MTEILTALVAAAALLVCFLVPGVTWGPLLAPARLDDLGRLGRATGAGVMLVALIATVLVAIGALTAATGLVTVLVATAVPLVSRDVRDDLAGTLRDRRRPAAIGLLAVAIGAVSIHLVVSHARLGPESLPATSTVWYYRHLAELVAETGGLPALFPEWGRLQPFHTDYLPFTAHSALAFSLLGLDRVAGLEAYRLAILAGTVLTSILLFRRWMPTWIAVAGGLLLVTTLRMDFKLLSYKPETFGLLLGLFALWLVDRAAVERSPRLAASAAVAMGLVVMSHAEVAVVLLPAVVGIAFVRGIGRPTRGRLGLTLRLDRRALTATIVPIGVTAIGLAGGLAANALVTGQSGLLGYVTGQTSGSPPPVVIDERLIPEGWRLTADPTWNFHTAAVNRADAGRPPPTSFADRRLLSRANLQVWSLVDGRTALGAVVLAAMLLVPLVAWPWLDGRRRSFVLFGVVFGVGLFAGAWLLTELSATYVPRRIGPRRLVPYELIVAVGAAMVTLFVASRLAGRFADRQGLSRRTRQLAAGIAVAAVIGVALLPVVGSADDEESGGLSPSGETAYAWLRDNLPEGSRVLANAYTDGSLTLLSGGLGILDGRAVYLEDPAFLSEATNLLLGARQFFADPANPSSDIYLGLADPDYLLVATRPTGVDLGGYRPFVTDVAALDADPRLEVVTDLADGGLRLYRVIGAGATG